MNGGYVMIKSSDSEIYSKAKKAIEIGKPILYYENDTTCYYIDSASIVGTDVILTKGGKTITIDSDNNVVSSGEIQNHLYLVSFRVSDDIISFLTTSNIGDYAIENMNNLTDNDIKFLKSLQGKFNLASLNGYDGTTSTGVTIAGCENKTEAVDYLALNFTDYHWQINLLNPVSTGDEEQMNIITQKLF